MPQQRAYLPTHSKQKGRIRKGGLVGIADGVSIVIKDCENSADVTSNRAGGIVAWANVNANIENVSNSGDITGSVGASGIAYSLYGTITASYCYNNGAISGADGAGAIAPKAQYGANDTANFCLNDGSVSSSNGITY